MEAVAGLVDLSSGYHAFYRLHARKLGFWLCSQPVGLPLDILCYTHLLSIISGCYDLTELDGGRRQSGPRFRFYAHWREERLKHAGYQLAKRLERDSTGTDGSTLIV